ncbi:MAG TPA: nucleoside deaminase [Bdellovibrionota bacterium]|nr:nucleoside deaminase [Bdellovibrionota bacterium]
MRQKKSLDRDWTPYMERALVLAREAEACGDVPVGALVVDIDGNVISEAKNERELLKDPTAHAEIIAIRRASEALKSWRLTGCTLVVTLEPCVMCAGALSLSRIDRIVFGAYDPRAGATSSIYEIHNDRRLNHVMLTVPAVLEAQCRETLVNFFRSKRQ